MTFYLKALEQKSHYPCEMIYIVHTQKFFVCGVLLYQEATVIHVTIISFATLLKYAFDQTKRPSAGRTSYIIQNT